MRRIAITTHVLNSLLKPTARSMRDPDRAFDRVVAKAVEASGGDPTGDETFIEEFRFLLRNFAETPRLTPLGWQSVTVDMQTRIENRLRIRRRIAERPEIANEPIERPIFIAGLPRTATTLCHNVIAKSDDHRGPLLWELFYTDVQLPEAEERRQIKRIANMTSTLARLAPMFEVIHPLRADRPDECLYLLPHGSQHMARALMPAYHDWYEQRDYLPDYQYLKQFLQVLQYGRPRKRWVLKAPPHLEHLDVLLKVFPDAKVVWTHRDPVTVVGSLCSLVETSMTVHVRKPDLEAIGATWLRILARYVERGRALRVGLPRDAIVDVPYPWLNAEPHVGVPRIYERIGAKWTAKDAGNLESVLERPGISRAHEYELARYGLTSDDVEKAFGDYAQTVENLKMR